MTLVHERLNDRICPSVGSSKTLDYNVGGQRGIDRAVRRNVRTENALRSWTINQDVLKADEAQQLHRFYMARQSSGIGFLYEDPTDFSTAADDVGAPSMTDVELGVGDGVTTTFQMVKRYVNTHRVEVYKVEKPQSGTGVFALDGVAEANVMVDSTTGVVTFQTAPGVGVVVTGGCKFDFPVRFAVELAGALATQQQGGNRVEAVRPFVLEELPNEGIANTWHPHGGSRDLGTMIASLAYQPQWGSFVSFAAVAAVDMTLPVTTGLPLGFYATLENTGTATVTLRNSGGAPIGTVPAGTAVLLHLAATGATSVSWKTQAC